MSVLFVMFILLHVALMTMAATVFLRAFAQAMSQFGTLPRRFAAPCRHNKALPSLPSGCRHSLCARDSPCLVLPRSFADAEGRLKSLDEFYLHVVAFRTLV